MADLADLERRVEALEKAQCENAGTLKWISGTLGQVAGDVVGLREDMAAMNRHLTQEVSSLRKDMPGIVAEAMREVLQENRNA